MQSRQSWMREFLVEEREDSLPYVGSITLSTSIVETANRIRHTLGLEVGWARTYSSLIEALTALRETIEQSGIMVITCSTRLVLITPARTMATAMAAITAALMVAVAVTSVRGIRAAVFTLQKAAVYHAVALAVRAGFMLHHLHNNYAAH